MGKGTYFITLHKPIPIRRVPVGAVGGRVVTPLHWSLFWWPGTQVVHIVDYHARKARCLIQVT